MEEIQKKWYQKKRYYLPLAVFGILVIVALGNEPASDAGQQKTQNSQTQVKDQTITIPANLQPLKIIQEQPNTQTQQQIAQPPKTEQSAPNYYINSAGNKVQSPTKSPDGSVPASASARCRDGSYSYSQNRRGTCSHHGGVATWLP